MSGFSIFAKNNYIMKRTIILSILFCQLLVCMARNVVTISGQSDWLFRLATYTARLRLRPCLNSVG